MHWGWEWDGAGAGLAGCVEMGWVGVGEGAGLRALYGDPSPCQPRRLGHVPAEPAPPGGGFPRSAATWRSNRSRRRGRG